MMASAIERSDSEELRKKLDAKELRAGDYQRNEEGNSNHVTYTDVHRERLSKIYNPEKETILREIQRLREYPVELEPIEEMDEDLDKVDEYVEEEADKEETWEEGLKPDFKSGRQLVEWLERKLPYLEPFAPDDAIHYCFSREWSREKFHPNLDVLIEEHIENIPIQDAAPHNHVAEENVEEQIENPYIRMIASPTILDGFLLQKMALQKDGIRTETDEQRENPMNEIEHALTDTLLGDTPKMVLQKAEIHVRTEADRQRENPMNEFEPPDGDTPSNALRITEIWSRFHKCLANKKAKMEKKSINKEKRNKMSVLSRLFGR